MPYLLAINPRLLTLDALLTFSAIDACLLTLDALLAFDAGRTFDTSRTLLALNTLLALDARSPVDPSYLLTLNALGTLRARCASLPFDTLSPLGARRTLAFDALSPLLCTLRSLSLRAITIAPVALRVGGR